MKKGRLILKGEVRKSTMLDAGCGNERLPRHLTKIGKEAVGLEINELLVATASRSGEVVCGSVLCIPFRDASFDEAGPEEPPEGFNSSARYDRPPPWSARGSLFGQPCTSIR